MLPIRAYDAVQPWATSKILFKVSEFDYADWGRPLIVLKYQTGESLTLSLDTLVRADFRGANFHRLMFDGMDLQNADFSRASLRNVGFVGSKISGVKMVGARLMNSYFMRVIARNSDLTNAIAVGADFSNGDFTGATLYNLDVRFANLERTKLVGADVRVKNAGDASWHGATYDENTIWPSNFDPEKAGAKKMP
ncbi:MAG: pentapeptide repeat-containing protein [Achromobacter sp.]|uniref:pentapeptide repeat-containing protein n=1 Tax=Achromobacter sp. TaxID=134375 RepID=UPI003CFF039B